MILESKTVTGVYIFAFFVYSGVIICTAISLVLGIFTLIPVYPFVAQNLSLGIVLIILSVFGIIGGIIGGIVIFPFLKASEKARVSQI